MGCRLARNPSRQDHLDMANTPKTISFRCGQQLFERLQAASLHSGISRSEWIRRKLSEVVSQAAKRPAKHTAPRRYYVHEIDPD